MDLFKAPDFEIVEKLEGASNYMMWFASMKILLQKMGLWRAVLDDSVDQGKKEKTMRIITVSLQPEIQKLIRDISEPKVAWEKLQAAVPTPRVLFQLRKSFYSERIREEESVPDFITRIFTQAKFLEQNGMKLNDEDIVWTLISGLPKRYNSVVKACDGMNEAKLTPHKVKQMILHEYEKKNSKKLKKPAQKPKQLEKPSTIDLKNPYSPFCFKIPKWTNIGDWVLHTAATHHMAAKKEFFISYKEYNSILTCASEGEVLPVIGKGSVELRMEVTSRQEKTLLTEVLHVPSLPCNILSVDRAEDKGCKISYEDGLCLMRDPDNVVFIIAIPILNGFFKILGDCCIKCE